MKEKEREKEKEKEEGIRRKKGNLEQEEIF